VGPLVPEISDHPFTCPYCQRQRPTGSTFYLVPDQYGPVLADPDCAHFNLENIQKAKVAMHPFPIGTQDSG
jgi:hypothetical protein